MNRQTLYRELQKLVHNINYPDGIPLEVGCDILFDANEPLLFEKACDDEKFDENKMHNIFWDEYLKGSGGVERVKILEFQRGYPESSPFGYKEQGGDGAVPTEEVQKMIVYHYDNNNHPDDNFEIMENWGIHYNLGKPLQLQDVLRAIRVKDYGYELVGGASYDFQILTVVDTEREYTGKLRERIYDLPMQEQSEEVLTNLIELLK